MAVIKKASNWILDLFFPTFCLSCKKEGLWICSKCEKNIKTKIFVTAESPLDALLVACNYDDKLVKSIVHTCKYKYARGLTKLMTKYCEKQIQEKFQSIPITSIPLHPKRKKERGFNQSELLAKEIAKHKKIQYLDIIKRKKYTKPQAKQEREERLKNIENAFVVKKGTKIPQELLLVDDVYTTGATMMEAAKVLKQAGVKKVYGMVFASSADTRNNP